MKLLAILFVFITSTVLNAGLINGVAVIVNEKPITLNELQAKMDKLNVSKDIAIGLLVEEKLYDEELKKLGISVSILEVEDQIKQVATSNNMDMATFKKAVLSQYDSYEAYSEEIKKKILHSKLVAQIAKGNLTIATENDVKLYYETNSHKFSMPRSVEVVEYSAMDQKALMQNKSVISMDKKVTKKEITFDMASIAPELRYMLINMKEGEISPVLNANNGFVRLEVRKRNNVEVLPYESVKEAIFQEIMMKREQSYLKEYFDKLKISAEILVLR
jgi:parvulin-like peptidyl-prolyl isomerase